MKNKTKFVKEIERELEKLNVAIDRKIIKGLPYIAEAKKHKQLTDLLRMYS